MSADMETDTFIIDPDTAAIIHRAEMQYHDLILPEFRKGEGPAIPDDVMSAGFADPGHFGLKSEWDRDLPVKDRFIKREVP